MLPELTWADGHPEVAELFDREYIPWSCEQIDTGLKPVVQPCLANGPNQELFVSGYRGHLFHSTDLGRTWSLMCIAPTLNPPVPDGCELAYHHVRGGVTMGGCEVGGIGATREGALLLLWTMSYAGENADEAETGRASSRIAWVTRSQDHGKTWEAAPPFEPAPSRMVGANQGNVIQLADGRIAAQLLATPEGAKGTWAQFVYVSDDDGSTWSYLSQFDQGAEPHIIETEPGKLAAAIRYQWDKTADHPRNLATAYDLDVWLDFAHGEGGWDRPTDVGVRIFQNTVFATSADGGRTWTTPRLVTGLLQQSASLVQLSDDTLVLTFGRPGQRFMLSYDCGQTWSRAVYRLHDDGEYARAVALEDDTIVAIHDFGHYMHYGKDDDRLGVLRFRVPARAEVEKRGFFTPREITWQNFPMDGT